MQIAIATCDEFPELHISAQQILKPLQRRGLHPQMCIWNDERVNWRDYDAVLLRSVWDYHRHIAAFRAWLNHLDALGVPVWNPPPLLRWNLDKRYLKQLAAHDVPVLPTVFIDDCDTSLAALLKNNDWTRAVVKPVISAGGDDTWQTTQTIAETHQRRFEQLIQRGAVMVQPFMPQIAQGRVVVAVFQRGIQSRTAENTGRGSDVCSCRARRQYPADVAPGGFYRAGVAGGASGGTVDGDCSVVCAGGWRGRR